MANLGGAVFVSFNCLHYKGVNMKTTIDMAREAGDDWDSTLSTDKEFLKRFEALVRADERAAHVQEPVADVYMAGNMQTNIGTNGRVVYVSTVYSEKTLVKGDKLYTTPPAQPAVPEGWKLVPAVPTNEWVNNLAKMQTGNLEEVPFVEIHQCIAELLAAAPKKGQP
jgi:hypothetical protein